jgi:GNAT superfamily N-acetyltransferase
VPAQVQRLVKKIRRQRAGGEIGVEQTHDPVAAGSILGQAGIAAPATIGAGQCFLMAFVGREPVGIIIVETNIDTAVMHSLFVLEPMRRRGAGAALVRAARAAAHARGARVLYAFAPEKIGDYLRRYGFSAMVPDGDLDQRLANSVDRLDGVTVTAAPRCLTFSLDISRDGIIER